MTYNYRFVTAGEEIQVTPKETFINEFQENLEEHFYESTDVHTIKEETYFASGVYQDVDVRITGLINPTTGDNIEDDFKRLLFKDVNHPVALGKMYLIDDNYWFTYNVDKVKTLAQTVTIRRCNNVLRWIDEKTGAYYAFPCSVSYLLIENRDYVTSGSAIATPSGMVTCLTQINSMTNTIQPNQRFILGNPGHWTAFRVEGGGINNFNNLSTFDNNSAGFVRLSFAVDYINAQTDDLIHGIANALDNVYSIKLGDTAISGDAGKTSQLTYSAWLNGYAVSRDVVWSSSNEDVATVDANGLVTFVATGSAVIKCQMKDNIYVYATCAVTCESTSTDVYQVVVSPSSNYILETLNKSFSVYLHKNGVAQADVFTFVLDANTVPSANYTFTVTGDNSFRILNREKFLTDVLEVTATSGTYSKVIPISLRGAW